MSAGRIIIHGIAFCTISTTGTDNYSGASPNRVSSLQGCLSSFSAVSRTGVPVLFIFSITSTIWCGTHNRPCLQLPTQPRRGWPHRPSLRPLLFSNSGVGPFTSHKNQISQSTVTQTYGFSSLSEKTRKSNGLQMSLQRQHFPSVIKKTRKCWSGRGLNPRPPAQQTGALPTDPAKWF